MRQRIPKQSMPKEIVTKLPFLKSLFLNIRRPFLLLLPMLLLPMLLLSSPFTRSCHALPHGPALRPQSMVQTRLLPKSSGGRAQTYWRRGRGGSGGRRWAGSLHDVRQGHDVSQGAAVQPTTASLAPAPPFFEDFGDAAAVARRWEQVTNGGSVRLSDRRLTLTGDGGKGFPCLTTRTSPFPRAGDWTVSFGYRFASIGNYGTEVRCDRSDGGDVVLVHQDVNGQFIDLAGRTLAHVPPNLEWHVVSVAKVGARITAFLDGKEIGGDALGAPPASIRLGGGLQASPWDWTDIQVRFVRVEAGRHPLGLEALGLDTLRPGTGTSPAASLPISPAPLVSAAPPRTAPAQANEPAQTRAPASVPSTPVSSTPAPSGGVKPGGVRYRIVNLGAFPIALHTNWFLELEVTNDTDATISMADTELGLLFGDFSSLMLLIYDPQKSYTVGLFLNPRPLAMAGYDVKAHSKKVFSAYCFDSDLVSENYYGQAHRAEGILVTPEDKRTTILPVRGF